MLPSYEGNIITKWPIHMLCVYFMHHPVSTWCIFLFKLGLHVALSYTALSYLGRQNELTFVGAIS